MPMCTTPTPCLAESYSGSATPGAGDDRNALDRRVTAASHKHIRKMGTCCFVAQSLRGRVLAPRKSNMSLIFEVVGALHEVVGERARELGRLVFLEPMLR